MVPPHSGPISDVANKDDGQDGTSKRVEAEDRESNGQWCSQQRSESEPDQSTERFQKACTVGFDKCRPVPALCLLILSK